MITIISPAKSITDTTRLKSNGKDLLFADQARRIDEVLKKKSVNVLAKMHGVSKAIAEQNYMRNQERDFSNLHEALPAMFSFNGEVYRGLDAENLTAEEVQFAEEHLRILSGMYGVLRPLDGLLPYRLEMGTKITVNRKSNLYSFWGNQLAEYFNEVNEPILNLASQEYFKAVNTKKLNVPVTNVDFKDEKNGVFKTISFWAKQARGEMARWVIQNRIVNIEDCRNFAENDYYLAEEESTKNHLIFHRNER